MNVGFVSYYIPQTNETHGICQYLAAIRPHFIENSKHFTFTERSPGESEERSSQAVGISSRVFVYHETFLSPEEIVELNRTYRAHGFDVIFRGPDYLAIKNAGK